MKKTIITGIFIVICQIVWAQAGRLDSLLAKIQANDGTTWHDRLIYQISALPGGDSALLKRGETAFVNAGGARNNKEQEHALLLICYARVRMLNSPAQLEASIQGIHLSRIANDQFYLARFLQMAALAYTYNDNRKATDYSLLAAKTAIVNRDTIEALDNYSNAESDYAVVKKADSALFYAKLELKLATALKKKDKRLLYSMVFGDLGEAFTTANRPDSALTYDRQAYEAGKTLSFDDNNSFPYVLNSMAKLFLQVSQPDSARMYAQMAYNLALKIRRLDLIYDASVTLAQLYAGKDDKKELFYLKAEMAARDSVYATGASRQLQLINDKEQQRLQDLKEQRDKFNALIRLYVVIGAAVVLLAIGIILWRNNHKQKRSNTLLSEQKEEITSQRDHLGRALEELKITQTQLVQREKMASLGELTAGIAHEIQNPLNFVNNFSEVNREMLDELDEELSKGDIAEAKAIAAGIRQNEEKINHHGKRADSIVKGMLEHSRTNTGEKQLTDLNVLCDDFIKLSYHGLCAKDKDFNAELLMHFDITLPNANVVPQDISRVMLNLFNNAFYAVNEKKKTAGPDYSPKVTVSTFEPPSGGVGVSVKDNGNGIPDAIKDKIMQPFFTTKPTGEGTGLGLSLSYDIVVKGHDGAININTKEGEFTEFIITLPFSR